MLLDLCCAAVRYVRRARHLRRRALSRCLRPNRSGKNGLEVEVGALEGGKWR